MLANPKRTKDEIVQWIREYFAANGNDCCAVIGISGGKAWSQHFVLKPLAQSGLSVC